MSGLLIKVCGMRDERNVRAIAALRPDFMGFIWYPPSPRHIGNLPEGIISSLPEGIMPVLVTVNMPEVELLGKASEYGFKGVQLHGDESPEKCQRLRDNGLYVMKAVSVKDSESFGIIKRYEGKVDMFVLDTAAPCKGGTGKKFDWDLLRTADIRTGFLLSGGIGPEDAGILSALSHPSLRGIDINSRFEISPGVKSVEKVDEFVSKMRKL